MHIIDILPELINRAIIYSLFAISFAFFYYTFGFFNFFIPALVGFGVCLLNFLIKYDCNQLLAIIVVFIILLSINYLINSMIFLPLINKKIPALVPMITSLGAYAIFMGLISIIWGNLPIKNDALLSDNLAIYSFSTIHLLSILIEFILLIAYIVVINTKLGLIFRAIQSNTELIQIYGINIVSFLGVFGILSIIYALSAGILRSIDHSIVPTSSFNLYIIGGVVLIIGGLKSKYGFIISALLISLLQSIITLYIDATWSDFFVYMILIIVLIFRPLGFSGKRLKKIEI